MDYRLARPHRPPGQPAVPRHHELRLGPRRTDRGGRASPIMDRALDARASTSSTPPTSTATGAGSPSRSSAAGSRRAAAGASKVVLATKVYGTREPVAERRQPLGAAHPPGVRGQPAAPADRPHRPLPDAPRRPRHAVGRDLAGDGACSCSRARCSTSGSSNFAGVAHRAGERDRARGAAFLGLVSEQSLYNLNARTIELEVLPGVPSTTASA